MKRILTGLMIVGMLVATGWLFKSATAKPQQRDVSKIPPAEGDDSQISSDPRQGSASVQAVDLSGAKTVTAKFILAVANPAQPRTQPQRRESLQYLADVLKKKVETEQQGDPAKLLGLTARSPFALAEPKGAGEKSAKVEVTFARGGPGGSPATREFTLEQHDNVWLISSLNVQKQ